MKCIFIKFGQLLICLLFTHNLLAGNPGNDFLITLDGTKLTGKIKQISLNTSHSQISFENDFGDIYTINPATIFGFTVKENGLVAMYESKYLEGEWRFLKIESRGKVLTLFTSSERQLKYSDAEKSLVVVVEKNPQFWVQYKNEPPFKIYKFNFKRILRKWMDNYSELEERIGKKGFRYKNLPAIVNLYNRFHNGQ